MKIIGIVNQKGGVGKSTTAAALAAGLFIKGEKVLSVDLDAQGNLTGTLRADTEGATALGVLTGEVKAADAVRETDTGDVIPSSPMLAGADAYIEGVGKEYRLKEALETLAGRYDYIVIDTPPALGILTVNALTASTGIVIPAQADIYSLQGIGRLYDTITPIRKYTNAALAIHGILLTRYSTRNVLSREAREMAEQMAERMGTKVFEATIREAVAVKEAQMLRKSIFSYAPKAKVTEDYTRFIAELLED